MKALIMPTLTCNLKCEYCYLQGKKTSKVVKSLNDFHPYKEWISGLKWFEKNVYTIDSVDFGGGEPFLYKDFIPLLKEILNKHDFANITTNLETIPEEFYELDSYVIGLTVSLHLDENGKIRKKFMETLERLCKRNFRITINFVGYPKQIDFFEKVMTLAKSFDVGAHLEPYVNYDSEVVGFEITNHDLYSEVDRIGIDYSLRRKYPTECGIIGKYAVFMPNGDVYPCLGMAFDGRNKMANIFDKYKNTVDKPIKCDIFCPCAQNYRDGFR